MKQIERFQINDTRELITVNRDHKADIEFLYYRDLLSNRGPLSVQSKDIASISSDKFQIDVVEISEDISLWGWPQSAILVLKFIGISIAAGFFGQIGADIYSKTKRKVKTTCSKPHKQTWRIY